MRTSNKILLGGFLVAILTFTGIYVSIYAKIKNGDLVKLNHVPKNTERFDLGNIKHVVINGMGECRIWLHDSAALEAPNNWKNSFRYRVEGDSLFITAGTGDRELGRGERAYIGIDLYLPPVESIIALNAGISMQGADDTATAQSRSIKLYHSDFRITGNSRHAVPVYWNKLDIGAWDESNITVTMGAVVNELNVALVNNSSLNDDGANFGSFTLQSDSTGSVNLRPGSLSKLKYIKP